MKKTKLVCTLGPSSDNYNTLKQMVLAGMNVARVNMSHGNHEQHQQKIDLVKSLRKDLDTPIGIMLDTKGPEVRIKTFENDKVEVKEGDLYAFTTDQNFVGNNKMVAVTYENLHNELKAGDEVLVNDGLLVFEVQSVNGNVINTKCLVGGVMSNNKGMHFPNIHLNLEFLSDRDKNDLMLAVQNDVEFIAASFVNYATDIKQMREFLQSKGAKNIMIIAKIESQIGVENLQEIIDEADGVMVARGDMGVELDYFKLPKAQKDIIKYANKVGKDVIVATEMLESMINKVRPTRAEISDVANAVYDEASAVMLSGETAAGNYPVQAVTVMAEICKYVEDTINYNKRLLTKNVDANNIAESTAHSASSMAMQLGAKAILVSDANADSAKQISKYRCSSPIVAMLKNEKLVQQMSLVWGVYGKFVNDFDNMSDLVLLGKQEIAKHVAVNKDDVLLVVGSSGQKQNTASFVQVERI